MNTRASRASRLSRVSGEFAIREPSDAAWPGARGREAEPTRARTDAFGHFLDARRRGRAVAAASGGGGRVPSRTDAGNIQIHRERGFPRHPDPAGTRR